MRAVPAPQSTPRCRARSGSVRILALVLLTCIASTFPDRASAQSTPGPTGTAGPQATPTFRHLTIADGLSQNAVLAMVQDRRGFLWFGTKDGLNRYDGHSFRVFRHDPFDSGSLSASAVTALFEDRDGELWVGTEAGGLDRFDRDSETFHRQALDAGSQVNAIVQGGDGTLWVATNGDGLARLARGEQSDPAAPFQWYRHDAESPSTLGSDFVHALLEDAGGSLWVGHGGGLNRLDPGASGFASYPVDPDAPLGLVDDRGVSSLHEDQEGTEFCR